MYKYLLILSIFFTPTLFAQDKGATNNVQNNNEVPISVVDPDEKDRDLDHEEGDNSQRSNDKFFHSKNKGDKKTFTENMNAYFKRIYLYRIKRF